MLQARATHQPRAASNAPKTAPTQQTTANHQRPRPRKTQPSRKKKAAKAARATRPFWSRLGRKNEASPFMRKRLNHNCGLATTTDHSLIISCASSSVASTGPSSDASHCCACPLDAGTHPLRRLVLSRPVLASKPAKPIPNPIHRAFTFGLKTPYCQRPGFVNWKLCCR